MRIRTIKPEFWTHPVIGRQSDAVKIVAIGLLNYADDQGYFYADPKMVRAAIRPLDEDSRITHGAITELSRIGYIELREHPTHGPIGRIVSFERHQVINRPNKSTIYRLFSEVFTERSRNDHGTITDHSVPEGKGREGKGREQGKGEICGFEPTDPEKSDLQLRAEKLLKRRPATPLSHKEQAAWQRALPSIKATSEEDWAFLEAFYALPQSETFSRKSLEVLLNNWSGEIDRARLYRRKGSDRNLIESQRIHAALAYQDGM